jgi:hypothetical protein
MTVVRRLLVLTTFVILAAAGSAFASAANIYITQNGSPSGNCTTSVQTPAFFNNAANWGSGASQIGPGTTVLLCGTLTGAAGANEFTFQGGGTSGAPVTLKFDTNAVLTAPYWAGDSSGAILCTNLNYITIDGGTNGLITNSANGTSLANQADSKAINFNNCSDVTIQNLSITGLYFHTGTGEDGGGTVGMSFTGGDVVNINHNTVTDARTAIDFNFYTVTSLNIYNNTTNDHVWGIHIGDSGSASTASGVNVYNNSVGPSFNIWNDADQNYHADGIFYTCANTGASFTNSAIYNNYIHGDMSSTETNGHIQNSTGYIYVDGACGGASNINIYNNVVSHDVSGTSGAGPEGLMVLRWSSGAGTPGVNVYNNTLNVATPPYTDCIKLGSGTAAAAKFANNVAQGCGTGFTIPGAASQIISSTNNVWYNLARDQAAVGSGPTYYSSLSSWQGAGYDSSSVSTNPNLSQTYTLGSGSSAISLGTNMGSLAVTNLNTDITGATRPASGAGNWDAGAYKNGSGTATQVLPPPVNISTSAQ